VAVFATVYLLITAEWVHRVAAALGGAAVMLIIVASDAEHTLSPRRRVSTGTSSSFCWDDADRLGRMLIVAVLQRTRMFGYLAIWVAKRTLTLAVFAGLFVMAGALAPRRDRHSGRAAADAPGPAAAGRHVLLWAAATVSAIVDDIPRCSA